MRDLTPHDLLTAPVISLGLFSLSSSTTDAAFPCPPRQGEESLNERMVAAFTRAGDGTHNFCEPLLYFSGCVLECDKIVRRLQRPAGRSGPTVAARGCLWTSRCLHRRTSVGRS